jgi:hypothetical protein
MKRVPAASVTLAGFVLLMLAVVGLCNRSTLDSREAALVAALAAGLSLIAIGLRRALPARA